MKKTSIHLMLSIIFSTIILAGCQKSKDSEPVAVTKENLAGSYKLTALTYKTTVTPETDSYNELEVCERDDIYTLKSDFTASYTDAGTPCDPPGSYSGVNWELDGNNIMIPGSSNDYAGTIKSFDGKTLVVEGSYVVMGITATVKATFTKQ
jgi:hypothetical protein